MRIAGALLALLLATPMTTHAIGEPAYTVTRTIGDIEERLYEPYVVAEVRVPGPASAAGNAGFRILAAYLFGKNRGDRRLEMNAPVTQIAAPTTLAAGAQTLQANTDGQYLIQFVLPRGVTAQDAPVPIDPRVVVHEVPRSRLAVIRYTGFWTADNYDRHLAQLKQTLQAAGVSWHGEPVYARYDPPFTPWFLRRNEIWLAL